MLVPALCLVSTLAHAQSLDMPASPDPMTTGECKPLRDASDVLAESGRYYIVGQMQLLAQEPATTPTPYVGAFLLASGPELSDWKLLTADAGTNEMTRLCVAWAGHGVRVRQEGNFWHSPSVRIAPVVRNDFPGCHTAHGAPDHQCLSLIDYLRQPQRRRPVTLLLRLGEQSKHWLSLKVGAQDASLHLQMHDADGEVTTARMGMGFQWKPNLNYAVANDPLLPLDSIALRKGDARPLAPPSKAFARQMETDDGNYDLDLFWTGTAIDPMRDAKRADRPHPSRAYEVEVLNDSGSHVLDTLYSYRPFLKYPTERQRRVHQYSFLFDGHINLRIRTLGAGHRPGSWHTWMRVPVRRDYPYVVATGGQSNVEAWFNPKSGKTRDQQARTDFRRTIARSMGIPPYDVAIFNVSQGGSAVDRAARSTPVHYWYDIDKDQPGPLLTDALARFAMWKHINLMVWVQGERETFATSMDEQYQGEPKTSPVRWMRATKTIFKHLRHTKSTATNMPIVFEGLGRLWYAGEQVHEKQRDRYLAEQVKLVKSQPDTWFGADASSFLFSDYQPLLLSKVHYGPGMYHILARRMGRFVGRLLAGGHPSQTFPKFRVQPANIVQPSGEK